MTRVLRLTPSLPHEKLPASRRRARNFRLPPRVRTRWMRLGPMRVLAGWRPFSKALQAEDDVSHLPCEWHFGLWHVPLLAVMCAFGTGRGALVAGIAGDTGPIREW